MKQNGWGSKTFLMDGFPRSMRGWEGWKRVFGDEAEIVGVLNLVCSEEVMRNRIMKRSKTSGRVDDNQQILGERFKLHTEQTQPVIQFFRSHGKVFDIDANRSPNQVCKLAFTGIQTLRLFSRDSQESFQIKSYLERKVHLFVQPLITDLHREKPQDFYTFFVKWMHSKGSKIK